MSKNSIIRPPTVNYLPLSIIIVSLTLGVIIIALILTQPHHIFDDTLKRYKTSAQPIQIDTSHTSFTGTIASLTSDMVCLNADDTTTPCIDLNDIQAVNSGLTPTNPDSVLHDYQTNQTLLEIDLITGHVTGTIKTITPNFICLTTTPRNLLACINRSTIEMIAPPGIIQPSLP